MTVARRRALVLAVCAFAVAGAFVALLLLRDDVSTAVRALWALLVLVWSAWGVRLLARGGSAATTADPLPAEAGEPQDPSQQAAQQVEAGQQPQVDPVLTDPQPLVQPVVEPTPQPVEPTPQPVEPAPQPLTDPLPDPLTDPLPDPLTDPLPPAATPHADPTSPPVQDEPRRP